MHYCGYIEPFPFLYFGKYDYFMKLLKSALVSAPVQVSFEHFYPIFIITKWSSISRKWRINNKRNSRRKRHSMCWFILCWTFRRGLSSEFLVKIWSCFQLLRSCPLYLWHHLPICLLQSGSDKGIKAAN